MREMHGYKAFSVFHEQQGWKSLKTYLDSHWTRADPVILGVLSIRKVLLPLPRCFPLLFHANRRFSPQTVHSTYLRLVLNSPIFLSSILGFSLMSFLL